MSLQQDQHSDRDRFIERMLPEAVAFLGEAFDAVEVAGEGTWVEASEKPIWEAGWKFRRKVAEQALQQRVERHEAAFSPSAQHRHRSGAAQVQG